MGKIPFKETQLFVGLWPC